MQDRSHPHRHFLWPFIRTGALGRNVLVRAQWHKKGSWAKTAATPERTEELNWRCAGPSTGLMGEACIHRLDAVAWFLGGPTWRASQRRHRFQFADLWDDGRDVPDTVQCVFEFPEGPNSGVRFLCDATLCNPFDSEYEMYYGTDSAILMQPGNEGRESKAWMFKEVDAAPRLGNLRAQGQFRRGDRRLPRRQCQQTSGPDARGRRAPTPRLPIEPIQYALQSFTANAGAVGAAAKDFEDDSAMPTRPDYRAKLAEARKFTCSHSPPPDGRRAWKPPSWPSKPTRPPF